MKGRSTNTFLGALSLVALASACASIMGVEPADLRADPAPEAGAPPAEEAGSSPGPCTVDGDCDAEHPKCVSGRCVECVSEPADTCPPGRYCLANNRCATGCKSDADCSGDTPICNTTRHQCVACLTNDDCPGEKKCTPAGACADACSLESGRGCKPDERCCDGFCVDVRSDPLNCNGCGNVCPGTSPVCCGGQCRDAHTSVDACGGCGLPCSTMNGTPSCNGGTCTWTCLPGFSHCQSGNTGCETQTTTPEKCGGCNVNCFVEVQNALDVTCSSNACTYRECKPGFVDFDQNRANGCEAPCGGVEQPCCPTGVGPTARAACNDPTNYCGRDSKCHACKPQGSPCTGDVMGECCGGKVCQPDRRCN